MGGAEIRLDRAGGIANPFARALRAWQDPPMRRTSVANGLRSDSLQADASSSPAARVERALALGRRDVALHAAQAGVSFDEARRAIERRRQARRRISKVLAALLA